jgi:hypothetical protein
MGKRIEVLVENIDLHLKTSDGKLGAIGTVNLSFNCPSCHMRVKTVLNYQGEHPADTERKCEYCEEPYYIANDISILPHVGDREEVEINKQMKPIVDRAKGLTP